ncbi:phosphohistidine phosphatase SixA [Vreelandella sp. EE22]
MKSANRLFIMRHGEAEPGSEDQARRLTSRGEREAAAMGAWLARHEHDARIALYASPYTRAQQTGALISEAVGCRLHTLEGITPDDDPDMVGEWLLAQPEGACIMLVSHMPLVGLLTGRLVEGSQSLGVGFATAAVAELEADVWASGCARLVRLTEPRQLS